MIKKISIRITVSWLGLTASCGSTPEDLVPYCSADSADVCGPVGFPFVASARSRSDACPAGGACAVPLSKTATVVSQPEPGKLCMKGTVVGREGFAWLILAVSHWNRAATDLLDVFDAKALGISELRFTVDRPPTAGVSLFATTAHQRHCDVPSGCLDEGWDLLTGPRSNLVKVIDQGSAMFPKRVFARLPGAHRSPSCDDNRREANG